MTIIERACANNACMPAGAYERICLFAEWTKTTPPSQILADQGDGLTFSDELLAYAERNGMSLDWFWLGDETSLVMQAFHVARKRGRA